MWLHLALELSSAQTVRQGSEWSGGKHPTKARMQARDQGWWVQRWWRMKEETNGIFLFVCFLVERNFLFPKYTILEDYENDGSSSRNSKVGIVNYKDTPSWLSFPSFCQLSSSDLCPWWCYFYSSLEIIIQATLLKLSPYCLQVAHYISEARYSRKPGFWAYHKSIANPPFFCPPSPILGHTLNHMQTCLCLNFWPVLTLGQSDMQIREAG